MTYLLAILGLSVLIVIHEGGHLLAARLMGMRVLTFSVGFGPVLLRWRGKSTSYQIAAIPLGGYVQIAGMNPQEELPPDDPGSYANKSPLARVATVFAGPLTNYLAAMLIMIAVMLIWGLPAWQHRVGEVGKGSPAARAGLRADDTIKTVAGKPTPELADVLAAIKGSSGKTLPVKVQRGSQLLTLAVTPARQEDGSYRIGVSFRRTLAFSPVRPAGALVLGVLYPLHESQRALASLGQLLAGLAKGGLFTKLAHGTAGDQQVGGPVEIVHQLSLSFRESSVMALIFLAMLSAYLGLFNLLPVPALDGGRLLFLGATLVARRSINQRFEAAVHTVGFLLLISLLLLVTYCDVARRVGGP